MKATTLAGVLCATLLAGCTGNLLKSGEPPAETFRLAVPAPAASAAQPVPFALGVTRPRASAALDTDQIAVRAAGNRFEYYAGARWIEPAPQMLQQNLVAALAATGRFGGGVNTAPARLPTDLLLDVELRRFEIVTTDADPSASGAAPVAQVQVQVTLVDSRRGTRLTSFVAEASAPASANRIGAVIAAFEQANAQVVADVVARLQAVNYAP